ncbi:MAG: DUF4962 domain-containing protein [Candidatus Latescibacteria bacterium]|nr:DUF4962 domain-containing protein [Candidatus Latescibacterota bacterium]
MLSKTFVSGHPCLYFTPDELTRLQRLRAQGLHAEIWHNLAESAEWCLTQTPRKEWIASVSPDPVYLNLYDRFYAMMHDTAVMEHLAFAYAYSHDSRYVNAGRRWVLTCCRVWRREADGDPDASKAYAVMRLLKGLAVGYDLLYTELIDDEREEICRTMVSIGRKYYRWYLDNPGMAGPDQDKHHGSVEAASFGITALALSSEVPEAGDWLDLMVQKHTDYLLPHALTSSGTQEQSSNFWVSTMQYRLFFMDALRRVTGRDLFEEHRDAMDGRIALAAIAGPRQPGQVEDQQSIVFGPSYGQLDYWAPVLLYLAREYRRPIYQYVALWERALGAIQRTRYITSNGEELMFEMGGYAYAWYDPTVPARVEDGLPLSFEFPDVNETYARSSYEVGAIVIGMRHGDLVVHAGGRPVLIDLYNVHNQPQPVRDVRLTDDRTNAVMTCTGTTDSAFTGQVVELRRPRCVIIRRTTDTDVRWWCHGRLTWDGNRLTWPDRTVLHVARGTILSIDPEGYHDAKIVGLGKLKLVDPTPMHYPLVTVRPDDGEMIIEIRRNV